jgi:TM2 domain-containing membrane protein YozV
MAGEMLQADAKAMMRYDANKKTDLVAYLLWFFLGYLGVHRFYLGRTGSGILLLLIFVISIPLCIIAVGFVGLAIVGIWWLVDALLIPGMTRDYNNRLINGLT